MRNTNSIPIDKVAARVIGDGEHFVGKYAPSEWRSEFPLAVASIAYGAPDWMKSLTGKKCGDLTVIHYVGDGKWLCRCVCGYYVQRKTKAVRKGAFNQCQECHYRETVKISYNFHATGMKLPRRSELHIDEPTALA